MKNNKMPTSVIYCRVSTTKQMNEGDSLENQEKACIEYCVRNGIRNIKTFSEAFTGKQNDRPEFNNAIKYAIDNNINYFIVFDIDRFSREGFGIYSELKENLSNKGIQLKDSKNIIGNDSIVIQNPIVDMSKYKWNMHNPNGYAEMIFSSQAKIEGDKILQRTISREMILEQEGYHVRPSNFGYRNKTYRSESGKKYTIQIEDEIEGAWVKEIFKLRSEGISDKEICKILNLKGFKSRKGNPLAPKYLQEIVKKPVYAGVISSEWTGYKAIKTQYPGLVSIDTFNKANRGKKIISIDGNDIQILYKNKNEIVNRHIIERRKDYNPEFQYSKVLKCPICGGSLTGNNARSRNGKIHKYYQCKGKKGHKHTNYSLKIRDVQDIINNFFSRLEIKNDKLKIYDKICEEVYEEEQYNLIEVSKNIDNEIKKLESNKDNIIKNLDKFIEHESILEIKEKELKEIKNKLIELKMKKENFNKTINLDEFKKYSINFIKHLKDSVNQAENPELIQVVFNTVFGGSIEFENIVYQTQTMSQSIGLESQQKNPSNEEFPKNSKWHPH